MLHVDLTTYLVTDGGNQRETVVSPYIFKFILYSQFGTWYCLNVSRWNQFFSKAN